MVRPEVNEADLQKQIIQRAQRDERYQKLVSQLIQFGVDLPSVKAVLENLEQKSMEREKGYQIVNQ